jgi:hypothetical protein
MSLNQGNRRNTSPNRNRFSINGENPQNFEISYYHPQVYQTLKPTAFAEEERSKKKKGKSNTRELDLSEINSVAV